MATVLANLTGDVADIVDQDFDRATVLLRANTSFIVDPDGNQIRVLNQRWKKVNLDGTFSYTNLVAAADTIVPGTLQYYLDVKVKGVLVLSNFGPFVLAAGDQDVTDLDTTIAPVAFNSTAPINIDTDVLAAAEAYTDAAEAAHVAASDPHPQYARFADASGNPLDRQFILTRPGDPFPTSGPFAIGTILLFGGQGG